jgi:hypothetical protein
MARKLTTSAIDHYERRTSSTYERICGDLCLICVFEMGADDLNGVCNAFAFSVGGFTSASCIFYLLLLFLSIFGQTIVVEVFVFVFFAFLGMFFIGCLFFLLPLYNGVVFCDFFSFHPKYLGVGASFCFALILLLVFLLALFVRFRLYHSSTWKYILAYCR